MIHELGLELQAELIAKGCPFPVVDGPEPTEAAASYLPERIVIQRDEGASEPLGPVRSTHHNPRHRANRMLAGLFRIYAQAPETNATVFEHRRRADTVVDLVICAMALVSSVRRNRWNAGPGKLVPLPDLEESSVDGGAVYELPFTFERAVHDLTWTGSKRPEVTLSRALLTGSPTLTFAEVGATGDTITRSAGSWITDGFAVGMLVRVRGSALNNVTGTIAALTATVLTFGTTDLANEGPVAGCVVDAGSIRSMTKASFQGADDDGDPTTIPANAETACGS